VGPVSDADGHAAKPRVLKSEEEVLAAEEAGQVSIEKTNLIVNCPVVFSAEGGTLPNIRIHLANQDPEP